MVQLLEVFVTPHHVALVMEYCNGGDLSQYIEHIMQTEVPIPDPPPPPFVSPRPLPSCPLVRKGKEFDLLPLL